jgi:hypothetical protein
MALLPHLTRQATHYDVNPMADGRSSCTRAAACCTHDVLLAVLLIALLPVIAMLGAYPATKLFDTPWRFVNFHLANRAWCRFWGSAVTHADRAFRSAIAEQPQAQIHFVLVLPEGHVADPYVALSSAQRCSVEAAMLTSPAVAVWVVGEQPLEAARPTWAHWRATVLRAHPAGSLGALRIQQHRWHPTTVVGAWLSARGMGGPFERVQWDTRNWLSALPELQPTAVTCDESRPLPLHTHPSRLTKRTRHALRPQHTRT